MSQYHTPVLLEPSLDALVTNSSGTYVDVTFGGGGHSAGILSRLNKNGRVIAFDRDSDALKNRIQDGRLTLIQSNFRFLRNWLTYEGIESVDGILADLGVSSHQFDTAERGFSFRFDAPLDMRMGRESGRTAADVLGSLPEQELATLLRTYGEVEGASRIARLIVSARAGGPIDTTARLHEAIAPALPKGMEHKALAKIYQALRIEVNGEMRALEKFLEGAADSLRPGGRLVVITYHSLEDRMVKNFIKCGNVEGRQDKDVYGRLLAPLRSEGKVIVPGEEEIAANTRARSAKLRIATKTEEESR